MWVLSSTCVSVSYPVLMEMISIRGFFLILGRSSLAPPSLRPPSFFWPNRRTEWPEVGREMFWLSVSLSVDPVTRRPEPGEFTFLRAQCLNGLCALKGMTGQLQVHLIRLWTLRIHKVESGETTDTNSFHDEGYLVLIVWQLQAITSIT